MKSQWGSPSIIMQSYVDTCISGDERTACQYDCFVACLFWFVYLFVVAAFLLL